MTNWLCGKNGLILLWFYCYFIGNLHFERRRTQLIEQQHKQKFSTHLLAAECVLNARHQANVSSFYVRILQHEMLYILEMFNTLKSLQIFAKHLVSNPYNIIVICKSNIVINQLYNYDKSIIWVELQVRDIQMLRYDSNKIKKGCTVHLMRLSLKTPAKQGRALSFGKFSQPLAVLGISFKLFFSLFILIKFYTVI